MFCAIVRNKTEKKNDALKMMVHTQKSLKDQQVSSLNFDFFNLYHFKDIQIQVAAQHFTKLLSELRPYYELDFGCLEIKNNKPSKVNKNLEKIERAINKTPVMV